MELKDKVVVITGGSKGLGRALAETFIKEGSKVIICSHHKDEVEDVGKKIGALGIYADVTKEEDLQSLSSETIKKFGTIDIWVNNAGIWTGHLNAEDFDMKKVREMLDVNIFGLINGSRVALGHMKEKNSGTIINILSTSALVGRPKSSMYAASKWAGNGFTKSIREENADKKILILSVFPHGMNTDIFNGEELPHHLKDLMDVRDVSRKITNNLKLSKPETEIVIRMEDL